MSEVILTFYKIQEKYIVFFFLKLKFSVCIKTYFGTAICLIIRNGIVIKKN